MCTQHAVQVIATSVAVDDNMRSTWCDCQRCTVFLKAAYQVPVIRRHRRPFSDYRSMLPGLLLTIILLSSMIRADDGNPVSEGHDSNGDLSSSHGSRTISTTLLSSYPDGKLDDRTQSPSTYRKQSVTSISDRKLNSIVGDTPSFPLSSNGTSEVLIGVNETKEFLSDDSGKSKLTKTNRTSNKVEERTRKLPEAIIIGVKKGGTRALLEFLKIHPDIRAPGPEIHFFDRHYERGLEWYRSRMPPTLPGQLTVEKTPSYFVTRSAPQRVYRSMPPDVRLIVVVRDPVTRALSDYTQALVKRPDLLPFERMAFTAPAPGPGPGPAAAAAASIPSFTAVAPSVNTSWGAIRIGLYARHLERWFRWFPPDRFHFVSGERLVDDPAGEIGRLEDFLGVQHVVTPDHFYFNVTKGFPCLKKSEARAAPRCLGQAKGRAHPVVDPEAIDRLRRFFRPHNRRFYEMTSIDFGWP